MRPMWSIGVALGVALLLASWLAVESRAQAPDKGLLAGAWALNHDASDAPPLRGERGGGRERGADGRGRMGRGGGFGGGYGGRGGGGRGGDGRAAQNPDEVA